MQKYFSPYISIPALIQGILLYHNPLYGMVATITTTIIIFIISRTYTKYTLFMLWNITAAWIGIGWTASWYEMRDFINFYTTFDRKKITITGTVHDYQYCAHLKNRHRFTIVLSTIYDGEKTVPVHEPFFVYVKDRSPQQIYNIGTILRIKDIKIKKPDQQFARYLVKEGVIGTVFTTPHTIEIITTTDTWYTHIYNLRSRIFNTLKQKLSSMHFALFSALFLGNKIFNKKDTEPIKDLFHAWGIDHIFARSGMHISIIISIILLMLYLIPCRYSFKILFITSIGFTYTICSWSSVSFIRSFSMFIFSNYITLQRRYVPPLHTLSLATLYVLLSHPLNLLFIDFQLSFSLTAALVWINTIILK